VGDVTFVRGFPIVVGQGVSWVQLYVLWTGRRLRKQFYTQQEPVRAVVGRGDPCEDCSMHNWSKSRLEVDVCKGQFFAQLSE
jgi:hypothetical protein